MTPRWNSERKARVFVARPVRTPPMSSELKRRRRAALVALYGSHCWLCNRPIVDENPTLDHIVPRAVGGSNRLHNLRLAHDRCNQRRADGPIPELLLTKAMRVKTECAA